MTLFRRVLCFFGYHRPAIEYFHEHGKEALCGECGAILINGKRTDDPEARKRFTEFLNCVERK
jgi:hypothetical protein